MPHLCCQQACAGDGHLVRDWGPPLTPALCHVQPLDLKATRPEEISGEIHRPLWEHQWPDPAHGTHKGGALQQGEEHPGWQKWAKNHGRADGAAPSCFLCLLLLHVGKRPPDCPLPLPPPPSCCARGSASTKAALQHPSPSAQDPKSRELGWWPPHCSAQPFQIPRQLLRLLPSSCKETH